MRLQQPEAVQSALKHVKLHRKYGHKEFVVVFNFLGKDSIRYHNHVKVDKCVCNNLKLFKKTKRTKKTYSTCSM